MTHLLLILPSLLLVALVLLPNRVANAQVMIFRRLATTLAAAQFLISGTYGVAKISGFLPELHWTVWDFSKDSTVALTVHFDNLACLMLILVSFVGWVICQYSVRYLDGEATQGRYFRWTAFAIGSVSLMAISGSLLMFMAAWVMTSTALHKLLLHYGHRPAAKVLELIMTAPMVVGNWINMQYYASTVDNHHFGSGNKTVHNVVGQFGILSGNGGDLKTGLPWQSLHTGDHYQHLPLRLQVVIAAPLPSIERTIEKHPLIASLITNGWLHLVGIENDGRAYRYTALGTWKAI